MSGYRRSSALLGWRTSRLANVNELRRAHAVLGNARAGRPPRAGTQQINEALVLRIVTEFQGFVRDLLDLAVANLVRGSGSAAAHKATLTSAISYDRWVDRGNPHLDAVRKDAERLGIASLGLQLGVKNSRHVRDAMLLRELVQLRNALAHDDRAKLLDLARRGARPTMRYVNVAHACLDRHARALDEVVWDHLSKRFPVIDPWSP